MASRLFPAAYNHGVRTFTSGLSVSAYLLCCTCIIPLPLRLARLARIQGWSSAINPADHPHHKDRQSPIPNSPISALDAFMVEPVDFKLLSRSSIPLLLVSLAASLFALLTGSSCTTSSVLRYVRLPGINDSQGDILRLGASLPHLPLGDSM